MRNCDVTLCLHMVKCLEQYELRRLLSDIDCRYRKIKCCLTQLADKSMLPELFHNVMQATAGRDSNIQWAPLCGRNAENIDTYFFVDLEF
jgi:hypothetical protein